MAKKDKSEKFIRYYSDPIHDDFAKEADERYPKYFKDKYKYIKKNIFFRFLCASFYYCIVIPAANIVCFFKDGLRIKNKKVLKGYKHQGYFLYCNHVCMFDPVHHGGVVNAGKRPNIIASHETWGVNPFVSMVADLVGCLPTPTDKNMYKKYLDGLEYYYNHKHKIIMYPEKHIWPWYNDIRELTTDTFRYPVRLNAPSFTATTVFVQRRVRKKPKMHIYLDGPVFPDLSLPQVEATKKLRDEVYALMKKAVTEHHSYAYFHYIYRPKEAIDTPKEEDTTNK